jgi:hypothetical protein
MPKPIEVFDDPVQFWNLLTAKNDVEMENQFFDRKEAGRPDAAGCLSASQLRKVIDHETETISAFANENHDGGLLVLGISKLGEVRGLTHLNDQQRNAVMAPTIGS